MATQQVYSKPGTPATFTESGGTATFTPKNVANGAGRVSNQWDRGAGALPDWFLVEVQFKAQSAVTIGNPIRAYVFASESSTTMDLTADGAVSAETNLLNFKPRAVVYASTNATGYFYGNTLVFLPGRYVSVAIWNASGQTLTNTNGDNKITLTPWPDDIQAPA